MWVRIGHVERYPVRVFVGDVSRMEEVREAVRGADAVIHTAGLVTFSVSPDLDALHRVNVRGTHAGVQPPPECGGWSSWATPHFGSA